MFSGCQSRFNISAVDWVRQQACYKPAAILKKASESFYRLGLISGFVPNCIWSVWRESDCADDGPGVEFSFCSVASSKSTGTGNGLRKCSFNPYPTAFPYGNGMVLHFYQQQESSTTKTVHRVINKGLKAYV